MINSKLLSEIIFKRDLSQRKVAHHLGMTEKTFYSKMKKGIFDSDEIEEMISFLEIKEPMPVFFPNSVTQQVTNSEEIFS
ncbi:MAG: DUF739 domain-containing protein [Clostridia bacterium]|nr:DUF739 domain-containing protein [Clostridia bacterium]